MGQCKLCLELFKELCKRKGRKNPVLCQVYEDYAMGKVEGEKPLDYVISIVGEEEVERIGQEIMRKMKRAD